MGCSANPLRDAAAIVGVDAPDDDGPTSFTLETTDEATMAKTIGAGDITSSAQLGCGAAAARSARPWAAAPSRPTSAVVLRAA
ncbi:MAG TPA: hypothetical protein VHX67_06950 [Acidimicrobiales bacterium]|jgi:hypothetical protein|nr:hypothetical protein [Acidimicrobiales bacterium]